MSKKKINDIFVTGDRVVALKTSNCSCGCRGFMRKGEVGIIYEDYTYITTEDGSGGIDRTIYVDPSIIDVVVTPLPNMDIIRFAMVSKNNLGLVLSLADLPDDTDA